jgi:hypothetical protein
LKVSRVGNHNIRRAPLIRGISLLDRVHVQELDQHVRGIAGYFLNHSAPHKDGNMWRHILPSMPWSWVDIDPEAAGLHLPCSVEAGNCLVELLCGGDVEIVIPFLVPNTDGVPSDPDVAER